MLSLNSLLILLVGEKITLMGQFIQRAKHKIWFEFNTEPIR